MEIAQKKAQATAIAIATGIALPLVVLILLEFTFGHDSLLFLPILAVSYATGGAVLGFCFPASGWSLGVWFIAFSLLLFIMNAVFVGAAIPFDLTKEFRGILEEAILVAAAFLGMGLGFYVRLVRDR